MVGKGGARAGAGRKPTIAAQYKNEIVAARQHMANGLVKTAENITEAAKGSFVLLIRGPLGVGWVRATTDEQIDAALAGGEPFYRIARQDPDLRAAALVFDRIMGKVPIPIDVELRHVIEEATAGQDAIARILQEHIPSEYLAPVHEHLERIQGNRRRAVAVLRTADAG